MITLRRGITEELLDAVWDGMCDAEHGGDVLGTSRGGLALYLLPFTVVGGYDEAGRCIGAVWFSGKTIHISLSPEARKSWARRHLLKQFFTAFFSQAEEADVWVITDAARSS